MGGVAVEPYTTQECTTVLRYREVPVTQEDEAVDNGIPMTIGGDFNWLDYIAPTGESIVVGPLVPPSDMPPPAEVPLPTSLLIFVVGLVFLMSIMYKGFKR